jgi:hypothetical protein
MFKDYQLGANESIESDQNYSVIILVSTTFTLNFMRNLFLPLSPSFFLQVNPFGLFQHATS